MRLSSAPARLAGPVYRPVTRRRGKDGVAGRGGERHLGHPDASIDYHDFPAPCAPMDTQSSCGGDLASDGSSDYARSPPPSPSRGRHRRRRTGCLQAPSPRRRRRRRHRRRREPPGASMGGDDGVALTGFRGAAHPHRLRPRPSSLRCPVRVSPATPCSTALAARQCDDCLELVRGTHTAACVDVTVRLTPCWGCAPSRRWPPRSPPRRRCLGARGRASRGDRRGAEVKGPSRSSRPTPCSDKPDGRGDHWAQAYPGGSTMRRR